MRTFTIPHRVDVGDLVQELSQDELFDLIVSIERRFGAFELTVRLCQHFARRRKVFERAGRSMPDDE